MPPRKFIGEYLLEKGLINAKQLKEALEESKKTNRRVGDILVKHGYVREEDIYSALSEQLGIAFIDVTSYQFDAASVKLIPKEAAERLQAIAVCQMGKTLTVAMTDPLNVEAIDEIEKLTRLSISPLFATAAGIREVITRYYGLSGQQKIKEPAAVFEAEETPKKTFKEKDVSALIEQATQAPVIKMVEEIIANAVRRNASDIHLEPQEQGFFCRYRIDGMLKPPIALAAEYQAAIISRIKIMADIDIAEKRRPQDGRFQLTVDNRNIDLRVATFPTIDGEHVSIRVLDKSKGILKLEELGLEGDIFNQFKTLIRKPHGLVLVTGPTGSGKTTTLYSVLNTINDSKKNIITLEDPVEYRIAGIHQSQVNIKAGLTFANGLRSIVRLDPDIIMIGEIRDRDTAEIAIHAALTGHLVFSTLHTNDAASACARLIDIGVEPYLISSSLTAVLAQRLIRKLCSHCRKGYEPSEAELSAARVLNIEDYRGKTLYKEAGCPQCQNMGFQGRTAVFELFSPSDKIRELITQKASAQELFEEAKKMGMKILLESGLEKVKAGVTSFSEILRVIQAI